MLEVEPRDLVGRTLTGATAGWFVMDAANVRDLVHVWIRVDGFGSMRCHTLSGIRLYRSSPHAHYEVPEFGAKVNIEDMAPEPLAGLVGHEIVRVTPLTCRAHGAEAGFVLETTGGSVVIAEVGDGLLIGDWADGRRWAELGLDPA
ncbi:hypothetical protein [Amycolatopsis sp.]|uniref:hypothetical protein n=1 Tax=Amycolatopsis sp. TaxID=37632 RepID=UPI002C651045|nr:hypothetical protein [Amycolatopsis sp.]HVV11008.1 hypothetical protein [Amycolatopsis sp.]